MRPLGGIGKCAPTTDAVFQAYQIKDKPAKASVGVPEWVPHDGDSLFASVLRAMQLIKEDDEVEGRSVCKLMLKQLEAMAVEHGLLKADQQGNVPKGDAPSLRWKPSTGRGKPSTGPEATDVTRLRRIVAAHVRAHFPDYYQQHVHVATEALRTPYTVGVLGWSPKVSVEATARWREVAQRMVDLDSTSAPIRDGLTAALRYQEEGESDCAEECLAALSAFLDDPNNMRHEIRDALVLTIATPKADTPTLVLNALADILGVYIDLYQLALPSGGAKAVCVESYGPRHDSNLVNAYRKAGAPDDLPLLQLLATQYDDGNETFYSYMETGQKSARLKERTPVDAMDDGDLDPLLQFYEAVAGNVPVTELVDFVDPCALNKARDSPQTAFQQAVNSTAHAMVPIRTRAIEEADYRMKDVLMTMEQARWATERMSLAHEHFMDHMSSRMGYGEVMLMQPPRLDPATIAPRPTGGEIAKSKKSNEKNWRALQEDERTRELSNRIKNKLVEVIDENVVFGNQNSKQWMLVVKDASTPDDERTVAVASLADHQGNKKLFNGYRQAMRLALGVNAFHDHEQGGWIALLAWWHRKNRALELEGVREEERAQREATNGQKLCETHSDVRSTAEWVKEKTGRFWRDLWTFMYKLDAWLDKDAPAGTREKVDALAADDAFAQATAWPALLSNS